MSEISSIITQVDERFAEILKVNENLRSQLKYQEARNESLLEDLNEKGKLITQLEDQISEIRQGSNGANPVAASQNTIVKINELVREIDNCIALLNR